MQKGDVTMKKNENISEETKRKSPKAIFAVTVIVITLIVLLNVAVSVLADKYMWYIDLSPIRYTSTTSQMYSLSAECEAMVSARIRPEIEKINEERRDSGEEPIKLNIVFCSDRDIIEGDSKTRYVSYTARLLEKEYPELIDVKYVNMEKNPSAVQKYKTTSATTIYNTDVIVEFGTESLVQHISAFYMTDSTETEPWAYNGEKKLVSMILSVTRAEAPICCITTNHGETLFDGNGNVKAEYSSFIKLINGSGYEIEFIDLEKDNIPEKCRMIITFDPQNDFKAFGNLGESGISEIEKLDKYIDEANTFFYICDKDSPYLENLEEYLEEWGVRVARVTDNADITHNYQIIDKENCADSGKGEIVIGEYATGGLGATIAEDMRNATYPPKVVFGNSTAIVPAPNYSRSYNAENTDTGTPAYVYYFYYKNGVSRNMLDVFSTSTSASAMVNGKEYEIATEQIRFKLMTITQEVRQVQESNYSSVNQASYVIALASTDSLKNDVLNSRSYGNADIIMSTLKNTGREVIPTDLEIKGLYVYEVENQTVYESVDTATYFKCLTLIPFAVILLAGIVVTVRRKYK